MGYASDLTARDYADNNLKSPFDAWNHDPNYAAEQYQTGLKAGQGHDYITISVSDVWSASSRLKSLSSYERIGYHARTAELFAGLVASGKPIKICRFEGAEIVEYWLYAGVLTGPFAWSLGDTLANMPVLAENAA